MVISHFSALVFFAFLASVGFGALSIGSVKDRLIYAAKCFVAFVGIAILLGWLMYPFPR